MLKVLHPNRWLMWAVSSIIIVFIFTWGQVKLYAAEVDQDLELAISDRRYPPLGSLTWKIDDKGKTYTNNTLGLEVGQGRSLSEVTYPTNWISKEVNSRVYFSNRSHQCVLTIGDILPPDGSYVFVEEKTVTTSKGDMKLNIFKNENPASAQKYLVRPVDGKVLGVKVSHAFGLIRIDDPRLCSETFGKILSTVKFTEERGI